MERHPALYCSVYIGPVEAIPGSWRDFCDSCRIRSRAYRLLQLHQLHFAICCARALSSRNLLGVCLRRLLQTEFECRTLDFCSQLIPPNPLPVAQPWPTAPLPAASSAAKMQYRLALAAPKASTPMASSPDTKHCGKDCQAAHWKAHKGECKSANQRKVSCMLRARPP